MNARTLAWTMLYASILGIGQHPRARDGGTAVTPSEAADLTDQAMLEWLDRFDDDGNRR